MRPENLAVLIADAIRAVVAPLIKQVDDLKRTVAALETRDARQVAAIADLQKSLLDCRQTVQLLESYRVEPRIDLHHGDPRH